ncbi:MAG: hypothetical protein WC332_00780 [Clostridia bacterium]|jgi:hypothetical protein
MLAVDRFLKLNRKLDNMTENYQDMTALFQALDAEDAEIMFGVDVEYSSLREDSLNGDIFAADQPSGKVRGKKAVSLPTPLSSWQESMPCIGDDRRTVLGNDGGSPSNGGEMPSSNNAL